MDNQATAYTPTPRLPWEVWAQVEKGYWERIAAFPSAALACDYARICRDGAQYFDVKVRRVQQ